MQNRRRTFAFLSVPGVALLLAGCGMANTPFQVGTSLSGNWVFAPASSGVVLNLGFMQGAYETVSAVARLNGSSCISPTSDILLTGSVGLDNKMMLVSSPFSGTTLTLQGQVSGDGKGIATARWSFAGGSCASLGAAAVTATNYSAISGTYKGTFVDDSNDSIPVSAFLEQTSQPDLNGQFSLSGSATLPGNSCFVNQPIYSDPGSPATLTAIGSFNAQATELIVTNWSISGGPCNGDSGSGSLTVQP